MRYDTGYERRPGRGRYSCTPRRPRSAREAAPQPRSHLPPPDRRQPFAFEGEGYTGPGEAGRYGHAPVPYGPDHTYDYHLGDRYGYGPDFVRGEERIRKRRLDEFRARRRPRR